LININEQKHQLVAQLNMLEGAARVIQELLNYSNGNKPAEDKPDEDIEDVQ